MDDRPNESNSDRSDRKKPCGQVPVNIAVVRSPNRRQRQLEDENEELRKELSNEKMRATRLNGASDEVLSNGNDGS